MVIDQRSRAYDLIRVFPFLFDQFLPDQAPERLGAIGITFGLDKLIEF